MTCDWCGEEDEKCWCNMVTDDFKNGKTIHSYETVKKMNNLPYVLITNINSSPGIDIHFTEDAPEEFKKDFITKFEYEFIGTQLLDIMKQFEQDWYHRRCNNI
jgi:hypothetical protein